jgi:cation/acetate symporter
MKGITYTQIAQYCVLITAYTIPAIFISLNLTGNPLPQIGLGGMMVGTETYLLDRLDQVVTELGFAQYTTTSRLSTLNTFVYTLSLMIGTAGLPHVIIRFFTVPKVSDARKSAGWALVFITLLYTTAPGVAAIHPAGGEELLYEERPDWFRKWETTGLLKFEDKNGDGRITYNADPNTNEMVKVDRDIMVLANPEIANLPNWVIALVAAGGLAAALSTAAGLLLAIASAISHDLLKGVFRPNITEKQELLASRIAMALAIGLAGYLGFNPPDFAAGTVALAFGLAASSIFPALMMGVYFKRINKEGAIAGMVAGITVTLLYVFQHKGVMFIASTSFLGDMSPNWFLGIEPNAFGAVGAVINFVVAYGVSMVTAEPPERIQHLVEDIRIPSGAGSAHSH